MLYAYLTNREPETCPHLNMPLHTVIHITPKAYGVEENRHELEPTTPGSIPVSH